MIKKFILITGGAGFVGSNFVKYFLKHHPESALINVDKLTYAGNRNNVKDISKDKRYTFVKADICDERCIAKLAKKCDSIINFAAETHVDRSIKRASTFIRTNVYGTYVLLEIARRQGIKVFLQVSTDEVYGSCSEGYFREDAALLPNNPYAASKAAADMLARSYHRTHGVPVIITRSTNNFGPYQHLEKFVPLVITRALRDKKVPLYGTGENIRDWIYVEDCCSGIDTVLHKGSVGQIYNIGAGNLITNLDLAKLILSKLGKPPKLITSVADRPGHDLRYALECSKVIQLGWKPNYVFEKALERTIVWYRDNRRWWAGGKA